MSWKYRYNFRFILKSPKIWYISISNQTTDINLEIEGRNSMDFSYHHDAPHEHKGKHHRNGGGLSLNQLKTRESRCIFTEEDLREMQDSNKMLIYNTQYSHAWIAKVTA